MVGWTWRTWMIIMTMHALLALSTLEILSVDDDSMPKLKGACSSCSYFSNENIEGRLKKKKKKLIRRIF
jgi:hypothetical protein